MYTFEAVDFKDSWPSPYFVKLLQAIKPVTNWFYLPLQGYQPKSCVTIITICDWYPANFVWAEHFKES